MPSDVAGTRARSRRPSPRERLLKAADELFYAEGINSVGIDRVIERADVARASLYSTFGSKDELIRAYLEQRMEITKARPRSAAEALLDSAHFHSAALPGPGGGRHRKQEQAVAAAGLHI